MKNRIIRIAAGMLLLAIFSLPAAAQQITGKWLGLLTAGDWKLRLVLNVEQTDGTFKAQLMSIDQDATWYPLDTFRYDKPAVKFALKQWNLNFEGTAASNLAAIAGTFVQNETSYPLIFTRDSIAPPENSMRALQEKYTKKEVYITMRDGARLFTSYYVPKDTTRAHPMLMIRTPYNSEPAGPDKFSWTLTAYDRFAKEDYIFVFQDVRGRFMSEGDFEDIRPFIAEPKSEKDIDEAKDTYDAVDWLVKNVPHNNGNVGVAGISYPGFYATMAILSGHPAIKAVSPQAPVTAWFLGDDFHHNGATFLIDNFSFYRWFGAEHKEPTRKWGKQYSLPEKDNYHFFLNAGSLQSVKNKYFGDTVKFWNDAFAHPDYDNFWKSRDPRQYLTKVKPAVMTVGGWFDAEDLYGTLHTYQAIEKQNPATQPNFLVMGPWSHSQWMTGKAENMGNIYWGQDASKPFHDLEVKFFDYYLLGKGDGRFDEATVFVTGQNRWKTFAQWPPAKTTAKKLYLQPGGKLSFASPAVISSYDEYVSDPSKPVPYAEKVHENRTAEYMDDDQRFASRRPDVMVYESEPLADDITLTGPLTAQLFVTTTGTDADYIVKLIDVFPEDFAKNPSQKDNVVMGGYQMLVRAEVMRGKYRNSFEKPEPFVPGKITEVKYELPDVAHTFLKGHRIMVQVQNSWFPLVDRNPQKFMNIYTCRDNDFQKATQRIYHDSLHPSNLQVKVLDE